MSRNDDPVNKQVEKKGEMQNIFPDLNMTNTCLICRQSFIHGKKRHYTGKHAVRMDIPCL